MNEKTTDIFGGRPVFEDCLPLAWEIIEQTPSATELSLMHASNEEVLKVIYLLDESQTETDDPHSLMAQQVMRIDAKVNFLMDMVGQLLLKSLTLPDALNVTLTSDGMEWIDSRAPQSGAIIHVQLYLKVNYPRPIILPAVVKSVVQTDQAHKVTVEFDNLADAVQAWIEKLIFRHHRRIVALSRRD